ncbi:small nuclear ribonucleoprotein Sm D1 [Penicillium atrosanguineum]|uniref:small nuclear ribonucleoprotein Sm D1 n=1 Tax=Penicillium atrosanguineum TaxID=1132637 RepID=UPI0023A2E5DA|nr:small nuclear ribonucleoprotein Sm D1 [Penicillium atrosanguineum]KAJ5292897.1 small nuclear ribonucleoprotein Sm D1 [Penicillium atrosanguineum]
MSWQFKLASSMRASPLRACVTRPNGLLLRPTARIAGGLSVSGTFEHSKLTITWVETAPTMTQTKRSNSNKCLNVDNINPHIRAAKYAVRGELAVKAEEYRQRLVDGDKALPFDSVIFANIGNPQQLDQKPITFFRQVLSLVENPLLLENSDALKTSFGYNQDVIDRAKTLLANVQSVGAYSHSQGAPGIRNSVAKFIEERDGYPANPQDLFLTAGASSGVNTLLSVICNSPKAGVLVPIPQYPLYTATLALLNAQCVPYYLEEQKAWGTDINAMYQSIKDAKAAGTDLRAVVVINPGNPTGASLSADDIKQVIDVAAEEHLVVIADEVYQTNVFEGEFVSFKKRLRQLQQEHPGKYDDVELVSMHSTSKGMVGECGHRGGYFELVGFDPLVQEQIYKLVSIGLCPPVVAQCLLETMVNPPREGEPSHELYQKEYNGIRDGLRKRAFALYDAFQRMEGVECQEPQGSMYLFPTIKLPNGAIEAAKAEGRAADEFYCLRLLEATGVCVVPGSGFGQKENTLHFRTTFLAPGTDWVERIVKFHADFMQKYR